jgi:hypothetical protein
LRFSETAAAAAAEVVAAAAVFGRCFTRSRLLYQRPFFDTESKALGLLPISDFSRPPL